MKKCSRCGQSKRLESFYKDERTKDGLYSSCKECQKIYRSKSYSLEYHKNYLAKYKKDFPDRYTAHRKVRNAVRYGKLKSLPCEICGLEKTVAHHEDYSKPLEVRWLCRVDHIKRHKELKSL